MNIAEIILLVVFPNLLSKYYKKIISIDKSDISYANVANGIK